jgi:Mn2+/Fe2+ NRAMP family transporter
METQAGPVKRPLPRRLREGLRRHVRLRFRLPARLAVILAIIGPGVITSNVDNDAGGITTYSLAGAEFGYGLLWMMIPLTIALIVVQEMCARMGVVTGKGLADLIREEFGVKTTFYIMAALLFANFANTLAEFAGVAAALEIFGITKYVSVPLAALFVWWLIVYGTYSRVEKVFLVACTFYIAYLVSGFLAAPAWATVMKRMVVPEWQWKSSYLVMIVGIVGTTIAPWMQFYLQSAVVEKGVRIADYRYTRIDVIVGSVLAVGVAMFIVLACAATLHVQGVSIESAQDAALALKPLAGEYCAGLFAFGLFNASLFAASVLPLSTAYYVCEGFGWETGIDHTFAEAPQFYSLYTALIVLGSVLILIPNFPLLGVMYLSQVVNGMLLPFILIYMLILVNRVDLMGEYTNSRVLNLIAWSTSLIVIAMTIAMVAALIVGY